MPRVNLTKREIDRLPFLDSGTADYADKELKGFYLRVGMETKTFFVKADVKVSPAEPGKRPYKTVKSIIGKYGEWTPEEARNEARKRLQLLKSGKPAVPPEIPTLEQMLDIHLRDNRFKPITEQAYRSEITVKFASWLKMTLTEIGNITPDVMIDRFKQVERDHTTQAAKNGFIKLQALLNYARIKYPAAISRNPCSVLSDAKLWPKTKRREDCLKGKDFKVFHDGIQSLNETTRDALLLCLYHGMRNKEVAAFKWEYIDFDKQTLRVPDTKNGCDLFVPLCRQSLAILERRKQARAEGCGWVFPTAIDRLCKTGHVALRADILKLKTGLDITVHGLRRSFITVGEKLKLRRQDIDKLTNHIDGSVTGRHYDQTDVDDQRKPLQTIANEIERLMIEGTGATVIAMAVANDG